METITERTDQLGGQGDKNLAKGSSAVSDSYVAPPRDLLHNLEDFCRNPDTSLSPAELVVPDKRNFMDKLLSKSQPKKSETDLSEEGQVRDRKLAKIMEKIRKKRSK